MKNLVLFLAALALTFAQKSHASSGAVWGNDIDTIKKVKVLKVQPERLAFYPDADTEFIQPDKVMTGLVSKSIEEIIAEDQLITANVVLGEVADLKSYTKSIDEIISENMLITEAHTLRP